MKSTKQASNSYSQPGAVQAPVADLQYMLDKMKFLHSVSQKISEKKPLPKLLTDIMESSKQVMDAEASSLLLYDPEDKKLYFQVATGEKGKLIKKYSVDLGAGIAGWVAKNKESLLIEDCYRDARFNPDYDRKSDFLTRSMICVPLIRKNKLLGVIQVINKKNGGVFKAEDLTIFETLAAQCAIAIENARLIEMQVETEALERELETAREIQKKLLPATLPEYLDIQVAARLIPARQVGGDYYNILKINQNQSLFFIADVTGKGIPAALIVSTIYSCLHTYLNLNPEQFDLMNLVTGMNKVLMESTTIDKFATCWFGQYDHRSGKLTSVNAGHNPPFVFKNGQEVPFELKTGGLFLGSIESSHEQEIIQLDTNDVLVFFTDGVTEAWNEAEEDYAEERLTRLIGGCLGNSAREILTNIEEDVWQHIGGAQQSDDFTCVVVKIL